MAQQQPNVSMTPFAGDLALKTMPDDARQFSPPARHPVYRSNNYTIELLDFGNGGAVFVSFAMRNPKTMMPFGESFFIKHRINAILVSTCGAHWYQYLDSPDAGRAIRQACQNFDRVITYGASMGAYAALAFSDLVGADIVLAFSPQYSVNRTKIPFEKRWADDAQNIVNDEGFVFDDMRLTPTGRIVIGYDPHDDDAKHVALFRAHRADIEELIVPFSGHQTLTVLAEMKLSSPFLHAAAAGDVDLKALRRSVRDKRNLSANYLRYAARCVDRRKAGGAVTLVRRASAVTKDDDFENLEGNHHLAARLRDTELAVSEFRRLMKLPEFYRRPDSLAAFRRFIPAILAAGAQASFAEVLATAAALTELDSDAVQLMAAHLSAADGRETDALAALLLVAGRGGLPRHALEAARVLLALNQKDEALALARSGQKLRPDDLDLLYFVACELEARGQVDAAIAAYTDSAKSAALPAIPHRYRFANLLFTANRPEDALAECQGIIADQPAQPNAHRLAGRILTRLGRYQEASNRLRKAVALSNGDAGAYGELATALAYLGAVDEALEAARSACSLDPRRAPLLRWVEQIGQRQPDRATAA